MFSNSPHQEPTPGQKVFLVQEALKIGNDGCNDRGFQRVAEQFKRHFPTLNLCRGGATPALRLPSDGRLVWTDETGSLKLWVLAHGAHHYRLAFMGIVSVDIDVDREILVEQFLATAAASTRNHFLLDQVLPRLLSASEGLILHAGSVRSGSRCIAFMGASGVGKSTITTSFTDSGFQIMGDDAQILRRAGNATLVKSVYPSLRLLPDTLEALLADTPTNRVAQYSQKVLVDIGSEPDENFQTLNAIFLLGPRTDDSKIEIRRVDRTEACMHILKNSFSIDPTDTGMAADRLRVASGVAASTPFFAINYPRIYDELPGVRDAILLELEKLGFDEEVN